MADGTVAVEQLRLFIERIERLEEDKSHIQGDLKDVYAEAKGEGFDVKVMRKVVRRRKQDRAKLQEEESLIELYEAGINQA